MTDFDKSKCPFCSVPEPRVLDSNELGFAIEDAFPVSSGHTLIISRRHVESFFELTPEEVSSMAVLLHHARIRMDASKPPAGYNIGINIGASAGQTIMHVHIHLIPRYPGDVAIPQGGVRNIIPGKAVYFADGDDTGFVRD